MSDKAVAGACAGLVSAVFTCPFDVVKTQQQAQGAYSNDAKSVPGSQAGNACGRAALGAKQVVQGRSPATARDIAARILAKDGIRGLYLGLGPAVLGYLPTWAIYFTAYDAAKRHLTNVRWGAQMPAVAHVASAMLAGSVSVVCTSPLWVVKTRIMVQALPRVQGEVPYRSTLDSVRRIYRNEGVGAFYRGLVPSLMGVSHVAVQFPLYDALKRGMSRRSYKAPDASLGVPEILACSSVSKMAASCLTYPHEVLRTRMQIPASAGARPLARKAGLVHTVRDIWGHEGIRGFYQGMGVNLLRTVPNAAVTILTYELVLQQMHVRA